MENNTAAAKRVGVDLMLTTEHRSTWLATHLPPGAQG
jgi:hypothetical protein